MRILNPGMDIQELLSEGFWARVHFQKHLFPCVICHSSYQCHCCVSGADALDFLWTLYSGSSHECAHAKASHDYIARQIDHIVEFADPLVKNKFTCWALPRVLRLVNFQASFWSVMHNRKRMIFISWSGDHEFLFAWLVAARPPMSSSAGTGIDLLACTLPSWSLFHLPAD